MGSWNGTCGISQLPIMPGDDVAIFLIKENMSSQINHFGCVHADDYYFPISPALIGKYDDCGRVQDVKADKRIIDVIYGKQDNYENIADIVNTQSSRNRIYFMLVHLEIYNKMVETFSQRKVFSSLTPLAEHLKNEFVSYLVRTRNKRLELETQGRLLPVDMYLEDEREGDFYENFYYSDEIYQDNIEKDPLIKEVIDFLVFQHGLITSRKMWLPQAGQGSQDCEFGVAKIVGEFVAKKEREDEEKCTER